jgi:hypothetical protein
MMYANIVATIALCVGVFDLLLRRKDKITYHCGDTRKVVKGKQNTLGSSTCS